MLRSTVNRAVHLRITPRPSNLGESREILRLVSQFGEVEYFKNLKYDALSAPTSAIVIFKDAKAASLCERRSPLRFRMGRVMQDEDKKEEDVHDWQEQPEDETIAHENQEFSRTPARGPSGRPFGFGQRRPLSTSATTQSLNTSHSFPNFAPPETLQDSRIFQIQARSAEIHFRDHIIVGHYHGSFAIDSKSIAQKTLASSVPTVGLSCVNWRAEEKPWRMVQKEKDQDRNSQGRRQTLRELYNQGFESKPATGGVPQSK